MLSNDKQIGVLRARDDSASGDERPSAARNVLGERLDVCSMTPMTGFFRDGCCDTSEEDIGRHTVCAVMTPALVQGSLSRSWLNGNRVQPPYLVV